MTLVLVSFKKHTTLIHFFKTRAQNHFLGCYTYIVTFCTVTHIFCGQIKLNFALVWAFNSSCPMNCSTCFSNEYLHRFHKETILNPKSVSTPKVHGEVLKNQSSHSCTWHIFFFPTKIFPFHWNPYLTVKCLFFYVLFNTFFSFFALYILNNLTCL